MRNIESKWINVSGFSEKKLDWLSNLQITNENGWCNVQQKIREKVN